MKYLAWLAGLFLVGSASAYTTNCLKNGPYIFPCTYGNYVISNGQEVILGHDKRVVIISDNNFNPLVFYCDYGEWRIYPDKNNYFSCE